MFRVQSQVLVFGLVLFGVLFGFCLLSWRQ